MELWMRLGVTADVTEEEAKILLGSESTPAEKQSIIWELVNSGAVCLEGETYIPEAEIEEFNEKYGTTYEVSDIDIQAY